MRDPSDIADPIHVLMKSSPSQMQPSAMHRPTACSMRVLTCQDWRSDVEERLDADAKCASSGRPMADVIDTAYSVSFWGITKNTILSTLIDWAITNSNPPLTMEALPMRVALFTPNDAIRRSVGLSGGHVMYEES